MIPSVESLRTESFDLIKEQLKVSIYDIGKLRSYPSSSPALLTRRLFPASVPLPFCSFSHLVIVLLHPKPCRPRHMIAPASPSV